MGLLTSPIPHTHTLPCVVTHLPHILASPPAAAWALQEGLAVVILDLTKAQYHWHIFRGKQEI